MTAHEKQVLALAALDAVAALDNPQEATITIDMVEPMPSVDELIRDISVDRESAPTPRPTIRCKVCNKPFKTEDALERHVERKHVGQGFVRRVGDRV